MPSAAEAVMEAVLERSNPKIRPRQASDASRVLRCGGPPVQARGHHLHDIAAALPGRSAQERLTAAAAADLGKHGAPPGTFALMAELRDLGKDRLADQLARTILEECPDISSLEAEMYDAAERLMTLPTFRDFIAKKNAETVADALVEYFVEKGDTPSPEALARIRACTDPAILKGWTRRAWRGETSAQIFGDASGL